MHIKQQNKYHSPKKPSYSDKYYTRFRINGKPVRLSCGTSDPIEAERISSRLYNEMLFEVRPADERPDYTVDKVLADYVKFDAQYKASFKGAILPYLERFIDFFGHDKLWSTINDRDIARYTNMRRVAPLKKARKYKDGTIKMVDAGRFVSPSTINKELFTLGHINKLVDKKWKYKAASFDIGEHLLEQDDVERRAFSKDDVIKIYKHLPWYWGLAYLFMVSTGLRAKHVFQLHHRDTTLRRRDIDFERGAITVWGKSPKKKKGKLLTIKLGQLARAVLVELNALAMDPGIK